jgi:hypothetical protein
VQQTPPFQQGRGPCPREFVQQTPTFQPGFVREFATQCRGPCGPEFNRAFVQPQVDAPSHFTYEDLIASLTTSNPRSRVVRRRGPRRDATRSTRTSGNTGNNSSGDEPQSWFGWIRSLVCCL